MFPFIRSTSIAAFLVLSCGTMKSTGAMVLQKTMIRSSLGHRYAVERAPQFATFLDSVNPKSTEDDSSIILGKHLSYGKIQSIIDVSHPYYNLCNERLVADNGQTFSKAFVCTVKPDMPIGFEMGSISAAEAGRHCAIAGSVAAALNQPRNRPGKYYYLALDNTMCTSLHPDNTFFADNIEDYSDGNDHIIIYAVCSDLSKRSATSQVLMKLPDSLGGGMWHLRTKYAVMSEKVFKKLSNFKTVAAPNETIEDSKHFDNSNSPYSHFQPLESFTTMKDQVLGGETSQFLTLRSSIPTISAESCLGHFDNNPAFPIAIMCGHLFCLAGETIGKLAGEEIKFMKTRPTINDVTSSSSARVKFIEGDIEAFKLVYAGTHGLYFYCKAEEVNTADSVFSVELKAVSTEEDNQLIARGKFFFQLVRSVYNN